ncbi:adenosylcobinamide-GDP ribazoletransferase [Schlegelella sp. S2-27]|uniref:Adenosylcobinamide-GDP ribazoletransferase n=1 Tax=Caldimonas mangrovi TaxID=2944811 RepID=A0ABT0YNJ1_9BURK|nr:adenosylcobinamide-GDP ribazoletransferase [Caldimonas mangrovi]MCM5680304.1 adenosylcobinamide-GDP ribazoletransferase [Caldimonas mangrovi]
MSALSHELRLVAIAWQFLTRVPLPAAVVRRVGYRDAWLQASARHFPLVGAMVGTGAAAVLLVASLVFPAAIAAGLCLAATLLLTGGFHEDGWADVCDGLGGSPDRERALQIMKDSRIGAYGAIGLVLMLGLKWSALASMPAWVGAAALLLGHTASRAAAVGLIWRLRYAGDAEHAKAKPLAQHLSGGGWLVALAWAAAAGLASAFVLPLSALALAVAAGGATTGWCARWFNRRLGGYTGDCLGATQQLCELTMYLGIVAGCQWTW